MPKNSYLGSRDITATVHALAAYTYSDADAIAAVTSIPVTSGTTLTLPPNPSEGDWYEWADEDGSCSATNPLIIAAGAGSTIRGLASITSTVPYSAGRVRYDANLDAWAVVSQTAANGSTSPNYGQTKAASGTAVAAAGVIVSQVLTPKASGKVLVQFSAGWTAPGAGVVTPFLQHTSTAGTVVDFTWGAFATLAEAISVTIEIDGLTLGTAYTFEALTTAGDHAITLGIAAAAGSGAVIRVSEIGA
jgi:hypothetical protein